MKRPDNWIQFRPPRFLQIHKFSELHSRFRLLRLNNMHVAVASFGGPIAVTSKANQELNLTQTQLTNGRIAIFTCDGQLKENPSFECRQKIVGLFFTEDQKICVFWSSGIYGLFYPGRVPKIINLGSGFACSSANCVGKTIVFLCKNKFFTLQAGLSTPKALITVEAKRNYVWQVSARPVPCLYYASEGKIYRISLQFPEKELVCSLSFQILEIGMGTDCGIALGTGKIAFIKEDSFNVFDCQSLTFKGSLTKSRSQLREKEYRVCWIDGETALVSRNQFNMLIDYQGYAQIQVQAGYIVPFQEIDGVRIYGQNHLLLRTVSKDFEDCLQSSQETPGLSLCKAYQHYLQAKVAGILELQKKIDINLAINNCIEAAAFSLQRHLQTRFLNTAFFGINFYRSDFPASTLHTTCKNLSCINLLRYLGYGRALTCKQLLYLGYDRPDLLVKILLRYSLHYQCMTIIKSLALPESFKTQVYIHWGCCKISYSRDSDDTIIDKIQKKFNLQDNKPFTSVAKYAGQAGKYDLALKLIQFEPSVDKRVYFLIWLKDKAPHIDAIYQKALKHLQTCLCADVVSDFVRRTFKNKEWQVLLRALQVNSTRERVIRFLRREQPDKLIELLKLGNHLKRVSMQFLRGGLKSSGQKRTNLLNNCIVYLQKQKNCKQQIYLVMKLANPASVTSEHNSPAAYLKNIYEAISRADWEELDRLFEEKAPKRVMFELIYELLAKKNQNQRGRRWLTKIGNDRVYDCLVKQGFSSTAIEVAVARGNKFKQNELRQLTQSAALNQQ